MSDVQRDQGCSSAKEAGRSVMQQLGMFCKYNWQYRPYRPPNPFVRSTLRMMTLPDICTDQITVPGSKAACGRGAWDSWSSRWKQSFVSRVMGHGKAAELLAMQSDCTEGQLQISINFHRWSNIRTKYSVLTLHSVEYKALLNLVQNWASIPQDVAADLWFWGIAGRWKTDDIILMCRVFALPDLWHDKAIAYWSWNGVVNHWTPWALQNWQVWIRFHHGQPKAGLLSWCNPWDLALRNIAFRGPAFTILD